MATTNRQKRSKRCSRSRRISTKPSTFSHGNCGRPIDELGLEASLENFVYEWSDHFKIPAEFSLRRKTERRLAPVAEVNLYRIAQESLNNIAKHAKATKVNVTLAEEDHTIALIIVDDGVGFEVEDKANKMKGIGLLGLGERAALLEGEVEIESAIGKGTAIHVRVPALLQNAEA